ncbi:ribosomal biogenesis factor isoform X1 [Chiroxiphia lanceolata]|uniref:ribosomal biogenesis factor isoform X1 n=1 Tax=Chiroxiphia lanceolata TaxID=296741 RepID=UPI0013CE97C5|nr:ribosomal biogenesis factor isoform X1 [Chiroxiphia lanceolata]
MPVGSRTDPLLAKAEPSRDWQCLWDTVVKKWGGHLRNTSSSQNRGVGICKRNSSADIKINIKNAEKVSAINKAFAEVQKEVQQLSKGTSAEPQKTQQVSRNLEEEPANVDAATNLLSQL